MIILIFKVASLLGVVLASGVGQKLIGWMYPIETTHILTQNDELIVLART